MLVLVLCLKGYTKLNQTLMLKRAIKNYRARRKAKEAINAKPEDSYRLIPWMYE